MLLRISIGRGVLVGSLVAAPVTLASTAARAADPDKVACAAAGESGYELKRQNKLVEARKTLLVCANETCGTLAPQCVRWLDEIDASLPTVVIEARDSNGDPTGRVRVAVDGVLARELLDGTPLPVDPGSHRLRFDLGGGEVREQELLILSGEKNRKIVVPFGLATKPKPSPTNVPIAAVSRPNRVPAFVAFGVGGLGVALGAVTGLVALDRNAKLEEACTGTSCPTSEKGTRDTLRTMAIVSTVGFGVGAVGIGLGIVLYVTATAPSRGPSAVSLRVGPMRDGSQGIALEGFF